MLAGPICQWSATKFSLAYHAFYVIRLRGIKFLVKSDQVLNSRDCLSEFVMQRLGEIRDWSLVLNWLKSRQVRQSSKVLFFCTWWELLLVWNRYSVCYCFIPPCRRVNVCLLFSFACYSKTSWGYSTGVHGFCGAGVSLNGIKHGGQLRAWLDLREEFTEQRAFIWNKYNKIV